MPTSPNDASPIWQMILTEGRVRFQCGKATSHWDGIRQACQEHPDWYEQHPAEQLAAVRGTPAPVAKSRYLEPGPRPPARRGIPGAAVRQSGVGHGASLAGLVQRDYTIGTFAPRTIEAENCRRAGVGAEADCPHFHLRKQSAPPCALCGWWGPIRAEEVCPFLPAPTLRVPSGRGGGCHVPPLPRGCPVIALASST